MERKCRMSGEIFEILPEDLDFYVRVGLLTAEERERALQNKEVMGLPTLCPTERGRRRMAWRNDRMLYKTRDYQTGEELVSMYPPDCGLKVTDKAHYLEIDNRDFGREFDFSRPFFPQIMELYRECVKENLLQSDTMENSEYTNFSGRMKNCYFCFNVGHLEDCMYCSEMGFTKSCLEMYSSYYCELCYELICCGRCFEVTHAISCADCNTSAFLADCKACSHCIGCVNVAHKEYHIFNQPVSKEKFAEEWEKLKAGSHVYYAEMKKKFAAHLLRYPVRYARVYNCEDSTGDNLTRCQNVKHSFMVNESKDCKYCYDVVFNTTDFQDISSFGHYSERGYELSGVGGDEHSHVSDCKFDLCCYWGGYDLTYCINCFQAPQNLFGCVDLRGAKYCILNKQYTKEEYEELVPRIIAHMKFTGEWGEFFPVEMSPFAYNKTIAQDYYPLSQAEVLRRGWKWEEPDGKIPNVARVIDDASLLPDKIADTPDDILNWAVRCEMTGRPFTIQKTELAFYRQLGLPVPHRHPEIRHSDRIGLANPHQLYHRKCARVGCTNEFETAYGLERPEVLYCEKCYQEWGDQEL